MQTGPRCHAHFDLTRNFRCSHKLAGSPYAVKLYLLFYELFSRCLILNRFPTRHSP